MDSINYLKKQLESMWSLQKSAVDSVTDEILMRLPTGTASPIGVIWLHLINAQDNFTGMLSPKTPLWQRGWAEKFDLTQAPDIGEDWTPYYEPLFRLICCRLIVKLYRNSHGRRWMGSMRILWMRQSGCSLTRTPRRMFGF